MRPRLSTILRLVFAVALTLFVLWRANPSAVADVLGRTRWSWIAAAIVLVIVDRALMAYRWIALLAQLDSDKRPPTSTLFRIFFVSTFLGTFLPAGVGADAVRTWNLARDGVSVSQSLASVLMDRLLGVMSVVLAAMTGLALAPDVLSEDLVAWALALATIGSAVALSFVFSVRVDELVRRWLSGWSSGRLRRGLENLLGALQAYRRQRGVLVVVLIASVAVQFLRVLQAAMLGRALGIDAPLAGYFVFIPVIVLVMQLPVTMSGLGTSQLAFVTLFGRLGVDEPAAFALSILFVALGVVGNMPGGLLYVFGPRPRAG